MDFLIGLCKVVAGAFVLFTFALKMYLNFNFQKVIHWQFSVGFLAFLTMVGYRLIDHDINVPSFTVSFFAVVLSGMFPKDVQLSKDFKGAAVAVVIGGGAGWLTFARLVVM